MRILVMATCSDVSFLKKLSPMAAIKDRIQPGFGARAPVSES